MPVSFQPALSLLSARWASLCRVLRWLVRAFGVGCIAFLLLLGVLRFLVLPNINSYRSQIAQALSARTGQPITIESIRADWEDFAPLLHLDGVTFGAANDTASGGARGLRLASLEAVVAWRSFILMQPVFRRVRLDAPDLSVTRNVDGQFVIAGIEMRPQAGGEDDAFLKWLFSQREIVVKDAHLLWNDAFRQAPSLDLAHVSFQWQNHFGRRSLAMTASPPETMAKTLAVRAELKRGDERHPETWTGQADVNVEGGDLGAWRPWVDYPVLVEGKGQTHLHVSFLKGQLTGGQADIELKDVRAQFAPDLLPLHLASVKGHVRGVWQASEKRLTIQGFSAQRDDGSGIPETDAEWWEKGQAGAQEGLLKTSRLDLAELGALMGSFPLPDHLQKQWQRFSPQGRLMAFQYRWEGARVAPKRWELETQFQNMVISPVDNFPGVSGFSGRIAGDQDKGTWQLNGVQAGISLPRVMPQSPIGLDELDAEGSWAVASGNTRVTINKFIFANKDAAGNASGSYTWRAGEPGEADLQGSLNRAEGVAVWRYMPYAVNAGARAWLQRAILAGHAPKAQWRLKGNLKEFPFSHPGQHGQFSVNVQVVGGKLDYAPGWPMVESIEGDLHFEGAGMRINASKAQISRVNVSDVVAEVPDFEGEEILTITGKARGAASQMLNFVKHSPVSERVGPFIEDVNVEGGAALDLNLNLPLRHIQNTEVKGEVQLADNVVRYANLPPLNRSAGRVLFSEKTFSLPEMKGVFLGRPARVEATTKGSGIELQGRGSLEAQALAQHYPQFTALRSLQGETPFSVVVEASKGDAKVRVSSPLQGLAINFPTPLRKTMQESWPLQVDIDFIPGVTIQGRLGEHASWAVSKPSDKTPWRGQIQVGGENLARLPPEKSSGVQLGIQVPSFSFDSWQAFFADKASTPDETTSSDWGLLDRVRLEAARAQLGERFFNHLAMTIDRDKGGLRAKINSQEVEGEIDWRTNAGGNVRAHLKRIDLPSTKEDDHLTTAQPGAKSDPLEKLPGIELIVDSLRVGGRDYGAAHFLARNRGQSWQINNLVLSQPGTKLQGKGVWSQGSTTLDFNFNTSNIGQFLGRMDYPDVVRNGTAALKGRLTWQGSPIDINLSTLGGSLSLEAEKGQFNKLEPGVGRLLGVLSLQSLPRRLTLDFRDIFSEGLAFDQITGQFKLNQGIIHTDSLSMLSPAAKIHIQGNAHLVNETQSLEVSVQPTLSESLAIGAAAAGLMNPVVGVVAYVAQKALNDPVEKLFSYQYRITGHWSDPKVEKRAQ